MTRTTLAAILAERAPTPGEAVTVLVPLLQTLDDLHTLDCTHGAVSVRTVFFDDTGKATLDGWGRCVEHRRGEVLAAGFRAAMIADCRAFVELARQVVPGEAGPLGGGPGPGAKTGLRATPFLAGELSRLERGRRETFVRECEDRLFALAAPEAVTLPGSTEGHVSFDYDWESEATGVLAGITAEVDEVTRGDVEAARPRARLRSWIADVGPGIRRGSAALGAVMQLRRGGGRRVRARTVLVAAVVCVAAVVGALVSLPAAGSPDPVAAGEPPPAGRGTTGPNSAAPASGAPIAPAPSAADASEADTLIAGDDPAAAAGALLNLRERCLVARSLPCLERVDQPGSAARTADRAALSIPPSQTPVPAALGIPAIPATPATGAAPEGAGAPARSYRLVQAVGASALVEVVGGGAQREPASVLLVKGEAGWRIRELFRGGP